ncbi:MAG: 16S rRNA (uracil(1498)-N(3))-methyltransferase [Paludibacter sp.]|nr:16S rRNA (uracil(1498)-N(3))-methyltransferase [Paludibacter sp.]
MSLFYVPSLSVSHVLPEEESQHAVKVLRLQVGEEITLVDGTGGFYKAKITNPHPKHCSFEITETILEYGKRDFHLHIAIAPTKNIERLEWFIEKATEIGIDEITPIICRFSERKVIKSERLEKIIVSAAKQSLKAYFPVLNPLCSFDELLKNQHASQKFIAHCYDEDKRLLQNEIQKTNDVLILIGPEGDFSKEEVQKALSAGFIPVSLGNSRLRTETAGVVACHTVCLLNE